MATLVSGINVSNGTLITPSILNAAPTLTAGTIVDADISSSAAIANSKLAGAPATAATASTIALRDSSGNLTASSFIGPVTGNVTGTVTGTATGLASPASKGLATAWVNFNGKGTWTNGVATSANTRSSYNVASVTRNGTGDFTITWTGSVFTDGNYVVTVTGQDPTGTSIGSIYPGAAATYITSSSVRIRFVDTAGTLGDPNTACVVAFGI